MNLGRVTWCFVAVVGFSSAVNAAEKKKPEPAKTQGAPDQAAMQAAWEKAATPGETHKKLIAMTAGTWTTENTMWMDPKKPPMKSTGTSENKAVLGDRFIEEHYTGTFMGKPFQGEGLTGFDNTTQKLQSVWVDTMGTTMIYTEGTWDEKTKTMTMTGEENSPMGKHTIKFVTKFESDKKHTMEMFAPGADGKEMKMMEIVYTKK